MHAKAHSLAARFEDAPTRRRRDNLGPARRNAARMRASMRVKMRSWRDIRGAYGRGRRALRRAMLEPVLVGWPLMREIVMGALAARGHLVLFELGDVRFFVDPSDRVVGSWLMWHGGWQRRDRKSTQLNSSHLVSS